MKLSRWNSLGWGLVAALAVVGCSNNPYPSSKDAQFSKTRPEVQRIFPALSLQVPSLMEFNEGEAGEFPIIANAGRSMGVVTVTDLPGTATFDPETRKISWTPTFFDGNDPNNPDADSRSYPVTVRLFSESDANAVIERQIVLLVRNVKRPMVLFTTSTGELQETVPYQQEVILSTQEVMAEQVGLYSQDLPRGASIQRDPANASRFVIRWTPDLNVVSASDPSDANGHFKLIQINLQGIAPRGQVVTKAITWRVRDKRQPVLFTAPTQIVGMSGASFTIAATNTNLDGPPTIQLMAQPSLGTVALGQIQSPSGSHTTIATVNWTDVPAQLLGTEQTLNFQACPPSSLGAGSGACVSHTVKIRFTVESHPAPVFDRALWPFGEKKQVVVGNTATVALSVREAQGTAAIERVQIEQSNNNCEITWANGQLTIKGVTPGLTQFNIVAQSGFGVVQRESFVVEVVAASSGSEQ